MKNLVLAACLLALLSTGCKKTNNTPQPPPPAPTNNMAGNWRVVIFDNVNVASPIAVVYNAAATSATTGTVNFDFTNNGGVTHHTENVNYTISSNPSGQIVTFVKTGGNDTILSGMGGIWKLYTFKTDTLEIGKDIYMKAVQP